MTGGGHALLGAQKSVVGNIQSPLFRRRATSSTIATMTTAVFAHFVS